MTPQELVANIDSLATLPEVALRIARLVEDPKSSAKDIGREIANDAALTGRLLRIANSPAFGQHGKIATISRAIAVLGVRQVRDLTVGLTAVHTFDGISNELIAMESFWRHSVLCAVAAGQIAARRHGGGGESPFIAGLLHDIGQLVLFSRAPQSAREALLMSVDATDDLPLYACEQVVLGFDHGAIGVALAQSWGLPQSLQDCIQFHHEPARTGGHVIDVATIHIANSIAVMAEIDSPDPLDAPPLAPEALRALHLGAKDLPGIASLTQSAATEILPLLLAA